MDLRFLCNYSPIYSGQITVASGILDRYNYYLLLESWFGSIMLPMAAEVTLVPKVEMEVGPLLPGLVVGKRGQLAGINIPSQAKTRDVHTTVCITCCVSAHHLDLQHQQPTFSTPSGGFPFHDQRLTNQQPSPGK